MLIQFSLPLKRVDLPPLEKHQPAASEDLEISPVRDLEMEDPAPQSEPDLPRVVSYRLQRGDTLSRIWTNFGAPAGGSVLAAKAFKDAGIPLSALRSGEELELQLSAEGDITALRKKLPGGKVMLLDGDSGAGYKATVINPQTVERERVASGTISRSFADAARKVSMPSNVVDELVDLFSGRVEFRKDLQPGDMFAVVYDEHLSTDGELIKTGAIKAASLEKGGRMLFAIRHIGKDGKARYYDQDGHPLGNSFLRYPLKFSRISSAFTYARFHPILKKTLPHSGIDFAAPQGTSVRAVADGVVTHAGYSLSAGNWIKIQHCDRYATAYLHLHRIGVGIRKGGKVSRGQEIGTVGSTGISTGPHLHFSFYDRGRYVNPLRNDLPLNAAGVEKLAPSILQAKVDQLRQSQQLVRLAALILGAQDS